MLQKMASLVVMTTTVAMWLLPAAGDDVIPVNHTSATYDVIVPQPPGNATSRIRLNYYRVSICLLPYCFRLSRIGWNFLEITCNLRLKLYTVVLLLLPAEATAVLFSASSKNSEHDNSWTAAFSLMKFCTHMYLDNVWNPIEFRGHRSKVKVTCFWCFSVCMMLRLPADST